MDKQLNNVWSNSPNGTGLWKEWIPRKYDEQQMCDFKHSCDTLQDFTYVTLLK